MRYYYLLNITTVESFSKDSKTGSLYNMCDYTT